MRDLETSEDCLLVVRRFYGAVRDDALLGPIFAARIDDWDDHLDTMRRFWSTVMLRLPLYHGEPLVVHLDLELGEEHFARWLALWRQAVSELFEGPMASAMVARAERIAVVFASHLGEVS